VRRILVVLAVALVMAAMLVAIAGPVFAQNPNTFGQCHKQINQGLRPDFGTNSGFNETNFPINSQSNNQEGSPRVCSIG
jgi:hypothetical protein